MNVPKKISPCPIHEAIVELRFEPSPKMPIDAIFGIAYEKLRSLYPDVTNLPILQIPENVRNVDPNLRYQPYHKLSKGVFSLSVGPRVLLFSCIAPYAGWDSFFTNIKEALVPLEGIDGLINRYERLGVRFVNFFESSLSENIALKIESPKIDLAGGQFHSTFIVPDGDFVNTVQVANKATVNVAGKQKSVSVLDIDTFYADGKGNIKEDTLGIINQGHQCEKKIFFSLLNEEALNKFNPEY